MNTTFFQGIGDVNEDLRTERVMSEMNHRVTTYVKYVIILMLPLAASF